MGDCRRERAGIEAVFRDECHRGSQYCSPVPRVREYLVAFGSVWGTGTGNDEIIGFDPTINQIAATIELRTRPRPLAAGEKFSLKSSMKETAQCNGSMARAVNYWPPLKPTRLAKRHSCRVRLRLGHDASIASDPDRSAHEHGSRQVQLQSDRRDVDPLRWWVALVVRRSASTDQAAGTAPPPAKAASVHERAGFVRCGAGPPRN